MKRENLGVGKCLLVEVVLTGDFSPWRTRSIIQGIPWAMFVIITLVYKIKRFCPYSESYIF